MRIRCVTTLGDERHRCRNCIGRAVLSISTCAYVQYKHASHSHHKHSTILNSSLIVCRSIETEKKREHKSVFLNFSKILGRKSANVQHRISCTSCMSCASTYMVKVLLLTIDSVLGRRFKQKTEFAPSTSCMLLARVRFFWSNKLTIVKVKRKSASEVICQQLYNRIIRSQEVRNHLW